MKPTREQVLAEPAGRRLDEWVFLYVLGHHLFWGNDNNNAMCDICGRGTPAFGHPEPAKYSSDIAAAWQVVERFPCPKFWVSLRNVTLRHSHLMGWRCGIELHGGDGPSIGASAETPALAICRAALLAVIEGDA